MSEHTDQVKISMGIWSVARNEGKRRPELKGKAYGLNFASGDEELQGEDFLTREEALELRDYITKHLGATA